MCNTRFFTYRPTDIVIFVVIRLVHILENKSLFLINECFYEIILRTLSVKSMFVRYSIKSKFIHLLTIRIIFLRSIHTNTRNEEELVLQPYTPLIKDVTSKSDSCKTELIENPHIKF